MFIRNIVLSDGPDQLRGLSPRAGDIAIQRATENDQIKVLPLDQLFHTASLPGYGVAKLGSNKRIRHQHVLASKYQGTDVIGHHSLTRERTNSPVSIYAALSIRSNDAEVSE